MEMTKLDSGAYPGPRSGIRRNDGKVAFPTFYERIITHHHEDK
jgi:hypothetical protein